MSQIHCKPAHNQLYNCFSVWPLFTLSNPKITILTSPILLTEFEIYLQILDQIQMNTTHLG